MASGRWRINRRTHLHWRRLGDDWVVFDDGSGDTHQLDAISAAALMCFEAEPHDLESLIAILAGEFRLPLGDALSRKTDGLIAQLGRLGLIEPASAAQ
jgi:PqqD family protein of HPr-rel-A system